MSLVTGHRTPGLRRPGAYILLFRMPETEALSIGRLGVHDLAPGLYAYVGSAMGGLEARVGRHLRGGGKKHWHIDHLMCQAIERSAYLLPSDRDIECDLARLVSELPGTTTPIKGFGSSDCRCASHLFLLKEGLGALRAEMTERGGELLTMSDLGLPSGGRRPR